MDDELMKSFVNESREHLTTIEADLLAIEEGGANIDTDLVNKVFRAAHSIKGASSFFGLTKVKELAHKAETVLDMMRSKKMTPNAEITNLLLAAFDQLREMINHPGESADADISELVLNLTGLASSYLPQEQKVSLTQTVSLVPEGGGPPVVLPKIDYDWAQDSGNWLYAVEYDLIHDIERRGRNVLEVFRGLWAAGKILECEVNFEAAGTLDDPIGKQLPLRLTLATIFKPEDIGPLFPYNRDKVKVLSNPSKRTSPETSQQPSVPPAAAVVPPPLEAVPVTPASVAAAAPVAPSSSTAEVPEVHAKAEPVSLAEVSAPTPAATKPATSQASATSASTVEDTIRVNVGILETLVNLAGELVLGRNQLRASIAQKNSRALAAADQRINQITSELQDVIMQTRLQPIGNVFGKFPRVVRDLSAALHKDIQLDIRGKDVALDKSLIEALSDPLTHMVRNAVDHGVESPEERLRAGKKRQGLVSIDARHEAGQVVVEIADDGQGIDPERVAKAALAKGLITAEKLQGMSAQDKTALVFLPGLSTAKQVSDVSGRGVGMDVVKTNLDRLGGKVEIISTAGKGTTFRIKLPLTLAIIPSLIVSVEGERFAIPQINVEEMLHVLPGAAKTRIELVGDAEVLVLRDRLIPLVRFADLLGVVPTYVDGKSGACEVDRRTRLADRRSPQTPAPAEGAEETPPAPPAGALTPRSSTDRRQSGGALEIVVVTTGTQTYALVVGEFHDTEEIVVKPLGCHLKGLGEYAGATILGDGAVALILDVAGLAAKANLAAISEMVRAREQAEESDTEQFTDSHALLLFHNAPDELCALPLDAVTRIEHITPKQVETIGGRRTMQYHGGSLPLVTLADIAQVNPIGDAKELAVMISHIRGHEVGLLGAMPVDVVETKVEIDPTTHRQKGVAGSGIIRNRTALMIDLRELVDAAWPEWAEQQSAEQPAAPAEAQNSAVLLAEDSDFFRTQVRRFLEEDGYAVLAAPDGEAAWELLLQNLEKVRTVVTDIEMPRLDGIGLAKRIRGDERTARLPLIALTSLASDEDMARGKAAGIDDYQTKLDRDRLLERVREFWTAVPSATPVAGGYASG
jgi:two-component system chemotaxis sensor kinase CheA